AQPQKDAKPEPAKAETAKAEPPKAEPAKTGPCKKAEHAAAAPSTAAANLVTWADVETIFGERCAGCQDAGSGKGGLDLSASAAARRGGGSGKATGRVRPD